MFYFDVIWYSNIENLKLKTTYLFTSNCRCLCNFTFIMKKYPTNYKSNDLVLSCQLSVTVSLLFFFILQYTINKVTSYIYPLTSG